MTTIQLPYRLYQDAVAMWLAGLNTRRLKVNLPLVAAFLAGLLWTRGRATSHAMEAGGAASHDALNRMLKGKSLRALLQMAALTLVEKIGGYLVLDDVVWAKRGKAIKGIAKLFTPAEKRYVRGFNVVVLAWTNGKGLVVPLTFRFWKPAAWYTEEAQAYHAFDGQPFRTKIDLAVEMLEWAYATGFRPTAVLFDAYYLAKPVLKYLQKRKWHWVSRMKTNRVLKIDGRKLKPKEWEAEHAAGRLPSLARSLRADLPGWGSVRVIASRTRSDGTLRFLVGSNPNWGRGRIESLYGHRWGIEHAVFRDGKQLVGLGDCQCRSFRAQENHVALALLSLVFLAYQTQPAESAGQALKRMGDRPIALAAAPVPAKVRHIKLERRKRRQKPHPTGPSSRSA